jgi:two-component system sensor histidine kinase UhpB
MSAPGRARPSRRWVDAALRVRLFWKILLANAAIVAAAGTAGVLLHPGFAWVQGDHSIIGVAVPLGIAAVALTVLVNALILHLALDPVRRLEETAAAVAGGRIEARVPDSPLADPDLARITRAFNTGLENAELYRQRLRELQARSVREEEEERRRVALVLHDDTAQRLAALLYRLRALEARPPQPSEIEGILVEAGAEVGHALDVLRKYALGRRPLALDDLGLAAAAESYARAVLEGTGMRLDVATDGGAFGVGRDEELALYRVLQEALDNVAVHSGGTSVALAIEAVDGEIHARVEDDGRGFDVEAARARGALGLFEMEERAATAGGRVTVESAPGRGTRVEVRAPAGPRPPSPDPAAPPP